MERSSLGATSHLSGELSCDQSVSTTSAEPAPFNHDKRVPLESREGTLFANVRGAFGSQELSLLLWLETGQIAPVRVSGPDHQYSFRVPVKSAENHFRLFLISTSGNVTEVACTVEFSDWYHSQQKSPAVRDYSWNILLGPGLLSYVETLDANFSEIALMLRMSYQFEIFRNTSISLGGFVIPASLSSTVPGYSILLLRANGHIAYRLPWITNPWSFSLGVGGYFATSYSSTGTFGYTAMAGPVVLPTLGYALSGRDTLRLYGRYSWVMQSLDFNSVGNELALGLGFSHQTRGRMAWLLNLDVSQMNINVSNVFLINSMSASLSFGLAW